MNQKNRLTNKENFPRNIKKKRLFILIIGGIIAIFLLIAIIFFVKKINQKKGNQPTNRKETNLEINSPKKKLLFPGEQNNCPFIDEQELDAQLSKFNNKKENQKEWIKKELAELRQRVPQDYIIKLWKKGYHHWDIEQLWDWGVREEEIPDLNSPKRVGVINELFVVFDFDKIIGEKKEDKKDIYIGGTKNLVVIGRKVSSGGQIYIDKAFFNAPMTRDEKQSGHYVKRIVNFALQQENVNPGQYDIFVLSAAGRENFGQESKIGFGRSGGKSAGSALYLALLSALYQKSLSGQVAATGALSLSTKRKKWGKVNGQEFQIVPGDNLPIGGLKHKVLACAKKGINFLVLSKYQTSPNLLSKWQREGKWRGCWDGENNKLYTKGKWRKPAEDYSKVVPTETREKMTVHWTENIYGLRELVLGGKLT